MLSKFSAAILGPVMLVLLLMIARRRGTLSAAGVAGVVALLAVATWLGVWAAYGFRYAPSATPDWLFALHDHPAVRRAVPTLAALVGWIDGHHLLPNAFSQGFLHGQGLVQGRPAFLAGSYSNFGWWYHFPVAFLLKTPLALLASSSSASWWASGGGASWPWMERRSSSYRSSCSWPSRCRPR